MIKYKFVMKKNEFYKKLMNIQNLIIICIISIPEMVFSLPMLQSPLIETPKSGAVIQGVVSIKGSLNVSTYKSYEVSFAYDNDDSETWFLIESSEESVNNRLLAMWDTSEITDGDYKLRVKVTTTSNTTRITIIENLHVRNYTTYDAGIVQHEQNESGVKNVTAKPNMTTSTPATEEHQKNNLIFSSSSMVRLITYTGLVVLVLFVAGLIYFKMRK